MGVSSSAYYVWQVKKPEVSVKARGEIELADRLLGIFKGSRQTYGSRRLTHALKKLGFEIGRYKVRSVMRKCGLQARYPKRFRVTTNSQHAYPASPNLLARHFKVAAPNQVWTTDISYVWTLEGWLYVAIVMDLYARKIVGYAVDEHMKTSLVIKALQMAYWQRKPGRGLIHHSDRGIQYASNEYRQHLKTMGMIQSMSKKGDCWDNAPTERFFRSLKYEQLNYEKFMTKQSAKLSIIDYLAFYNGRRLHSTLGGQTPLIFEQQFYKQVA